MKLISTTNYCPFCKQTINSNICQKCRVILNFQMGNHTTKDEIYEDGLHSHLEGNDFYLQITMNRIIPDDFTNFHQDLILKIFHIDSEIIFALNTGYFIGDCFYNAGRNNNLSMPIILNQNPILIDLYLATPIYPYMKIMDRRTIAINQSEIIEKLKTIIKLQLTNSFDIHKQDSIREMSYSKYPTSMDLFNSNEKLLGVIYVPTNYS